MPTNTRPPGVGVLAALEGAGLIAWHLVATPFVGASACTGAPGSPRRPSHFPVTSWFQTRNGLTHSASTSLHRRRRSGPGSRKSDSGAAAFTAIRRWRTWSVARSGTPPSSSPSISIPRSGKRSTCIRRHRLCGSKSWTRRTRWFSSAPRQTSPTNKAGGFRRGSSSSGPDQPARVDSSPVAAVIFPRAGQPGSLSDASPSNPLHS